APPAELRQGDTASSARRSVVGRLLQSDAAYGAEGRGDLPILRVGWIQSPCEAGVHRKAGCVTGDGRGARSARFRAHIRRISRRTVMAKYLISFSSAAMKVPDGEWEAVVRDSHAVIREA